MSFVSIPWRPSQKDLRIFAGLQMAFFALIAWSVWRRSETPSAAATILTVSVIVGVVGLVAPSAIRWIYVGWMLAVFPIGWVVSHVIVAAVFYLVITPIGLLLKLSGRDLLDRRFDPSATSYWKERPAPPDTSRYFRQF